MSYLTSTKTVNGSTSGELIWRGAKILGCTATPAIPGTVGIHSLMGYRETVGHSWMDYTIGFCGDRHTMNDFNHNGGFGFIGTPNMGDIQRLQDRVAALEERLAVLEKPKCCNGGPQWGHDWHCPTLP